jgi:hypothetical protein
MVYAMNGDAIKMKSLKKQKGLSLIELMVAMVLGVLLLMALTTLFITANESSKRRSTSENLDEVARQVMERLNYDLHEAGYLDPFSSASAAKSAFDLEDPHVLAIYARQKDNLTGNLKEATTLGKFTNGKVVPLLGCNGEFSGSSRPSLTELATCINTTLQVRQSIQIGYQTVAPDNLKNQEIKNKNKTAPSPSLASKGQEFDSLSGAGRDCIGRKVGDPNGLVVNRYSVRIDNGIGSFGCSSSASTGSEAGGPWQGIIEGVEEMTFRYLITPANNTPAGETVNISESTSGREVLKYLSASKVEEEDLKWASVVGVEVCLIVAVEPMDGTKEASFAKVQPSVPTCARQAGVNAITAEAPFSADKARAGGDSRLYKRYVQVISMPNSLYIP